MWRCVRVADQVWNPTHLFNRSWTVVREYFRKALHLPTIFLCLTTRKGLPSILARLSSNLVSVAISIGLQAEMTVRVQGQNNGQLPHDLTFAFDVVHVTAVVLILMTNISATSVMAYKLWYAMDF